MAGHPRVGNNQAMDWTSSCVAVVPCLNEAAFIGEVVAGVRRHLPTVLVVDDGSVDGTEPAARKAGAEVVRHPNWQGKGAAIQSGCTWARDRAFEWVILLDGDGQHAPGDIPAFFDCADREGAQLVVGNRMQGAQAMPFIRRWVNRWMSARLSRWAGQVWPDTQCGFRLIQLDTWATLPLHATHFEIESEMLLAFAAAGARIAFVPIRVIYQVERSKIRPWRDTVRWLRWWRAVKRAGGPKGRPTASAALQPPGAENRK